MAVTASVTVVVSPTYVDRKRGRDVGSKDISLRQGIAVSNVDQWISNALAGDGSSESTVDEMLRHPQVKKHGTFSRLSASQQNLVTSVVSVMQDKATSDVKNNAETLKQIILAEREALKAMSNSFASTAKSLYKLPLIAPTKQYEHNDFHQAETVPETARDTFKAHDVPVTNENSAHWSRFISWGNMLAVAALVLLVLVVKTSVETANFETQYHNAVKEVDSLESIIEAKNQKYEGLLEEMQLAQVKVASLSSDIEGLKKGEAQKQAIFQATIKQQESKLEKMAILSSAAKETLNGEIQALQAELSIYKGKDIDQTEQSEIWKQLAQERKDELHKLQAQIVTLSELSRKEPDTSWSLF
ncbi:hypothetical protein A9Q99_14855 [Gammaproteobacteria bacterium 45_16_T64]|nr:hypothetical protein A9Q99_14855 [Gammaproteobacteria bacterium 45_16_T64]